MKFNWRQQRRILPLFGCLHFNCTTALLENLHKNSILVVCETREHTTCDWIEEDRSEFLSKHQVEQREIIAHRIKKFMTISLKLEVAAISSQVRISVQRKMNSLFISRSETMIEWEEGIQTLNIFSAAVDQQTTTMRSWPNFLHFLHTFFWLKAMKNFRNSWPNKSNLRLSQFSPFLDHLRIFFNQVHALGSHGSCMQSAKVHRFHWFALFSVWWDYNLCNDDGNFHHRKITAIIQLM